MAYLYRHIRLDKNEPFYIGIGSSSNNSRAYAKSNRNKHWTNIVRNTEYDVEILFDNISEEDARKKEVEFIKLYGRVDLRNGTLTNLTDGGDGCLGRKMLDETKIKIGNSNKGKIRTDEYIKSCSIRQKAIMNDLDKSKKHRESLKNNKIPIRADNQKAVLQYDLDGKFIKEFASIIKATIQFGKDKSSMISRCCNNKIKTSCGYVWKFKINELKNK
jgi:hypothetical protein